MTRAPLGWGVAAFLVWFWYAQFVPMLGWNGMELLIANHIIDHGTFVTSLDYPTALTWRPVVPTLTITGLRLFTDEPILIYQWACGLSLGVMTGSMYVAGRRIWGGAMGHVAAVLTLACPAITTYLINHVLSGSHVVTMLFLGPAVAASTEVTMRAVEGRRSGYPLTLAVGLLWSLAVLSRGEILLFAGASFAIHLWVSRRDRHQLVRVCAGIVLFASVFIPVDRYVAHAAERDGILIRKTIYRMYLSQVWVDAPPLVGNDLEPQGYAYAVKLYGTPEENGESMVRAIQRNPQAFLRRVRLNAANFYRWMRDPAFLPAWWGIGAIVAVVLATTSLVTRGTRWSIVLLVLMYAATHFILIFHIDPRYLTIGMPSLILLLTGLPALLWKLAERRRQSIRRLAIALIAGAALVPVHGAWNRIQSHGPRNDAGPDAMRALAEHFRSSVPRPALAANREPHIAFVFPDKHPIRWEDSFLLGYFARTAWHNHWSESVMPTGRFYSWRSCQDDYMYVPAEKYTSEAFAGWRLVGETPNPVLGPYVLLERVR